MKILIHACPQRMGYVENFLLPELLKQGAEEVEIWNDIDRRGNLLACMESFRCREGDGGTWHIQDDVFPSHDFVARCLEHDEGIVNAFCCSQFGDDPAALGRVYAPSAWHSFQCIRIPDPLARECAAWVFSGKWQASPSAELPILWQLEKGDDSFFHEFLQMEHGGETVYNLAPNLVEHIDWLLGGSVLHSWRDYLARADFFQDLNRLEDLKPKIKACV